MIAVTAVLLQRGLQQPQYLTAAHLFGQLLMALRVAPSLVARLASVRMREVGSVDQGTETTEAARMCSRESATSVLRLPQMSGTV
jgi:hypothetical protein